jgi:hypothetical protein
MAKDGNGEKQENENIEKSGIRNPKVKMRLTSHFLFCTRARERARRRKEREETRTKSERSSKSSIRGVHDDDMMK